MLLYRLENLEGQGVYYINYDGGDPVLYTPECPAHPMPQSDPLLKEWVTGRAKQYGWKDMRFAFESMEALNEWFDDAMKAEVRAFVWVSIYEADVYVLGQKQAIFDRTQAQLKDVNPL